MFIKCLNVGRYETNCYILCDKVANKAAVIDPGFEAPRIIAALQESECTAEYVILTHGHFDHISAANELIDKTGAKLAVCSEEISLLNDPEKNLASAVTPGKFRPFKPDILFNDGDTLTLGTMELKIMYTPGHSQGSCCIICQDTIFSGDTLFKDSAGRTDLPTGSHTRLLASLKKLAALEGNYKVFPGHGEFTTLDYERSHNNFIYMAEKGYDDF